MWHLVAYSFISGVISALMMPAQKAYLAQLVDRKTLLNAVALTFASMGLMGIFGASLAGFAIEWWGAEAVYSSHRRGLYRLPSGPEAPATRTMSSSRDPSSVVERPSGGHTLRQNQARHPALLALVVVRVILGWSYSTLMPVYASEVMHLGARGLGLLSAAPGVGSLVGSLALASLGDFRGKGKVMLISGGVMGLALVGFSNARHFAVAFLFLLLVGLRAAVSSSPARPWSRSTARMPIVGASWRCT